MTRFGRFACLRRASLTRSCPAGPSVNPRRRTKDPKAKETIARAVAAPIASCDPNRPPLRRLSDSRFAGDVAGLNDGPAFFCTVASFPVAGFQVRGPEHWRLGTGNWKLILGESHDGESNDRDQRSTGQEAP